MSARYSPAIAISLVLILSLCACSAPDSVQVGAIHDSGANAEELPACTGSTCATDEDCAGGGTCSGPPCDAKDGGVRQTCIEPLCAAYNGGAACTLDEHCPPIAPPACARCEPVGGSMACVCHGDATSCPAMPSEQKEGGM